MLCHDTSYRANLHFYSRKTAIESASQSIEKTENEDIEILKLHFNTQFKIEMKLHLKDNKTEASK